MSGPADRGRLAGIAVAAAIVAGVVVFLVSGMGGGSDRPAAGSAGEDDGVTLYVDAKSRGGRCDDTRAVERVSEARPYCTLARAVAAAPADATVIVRQGRYEDLAVAGRTGRPLTVRAAKGEEPVIRGLNIVASRHLTVAGFKITDLARLSSSYQVTVEDNELTPNGFIVTGGADLVFRRNAIHDLTIAVPKRKNAKGDRCNPFSDGAGIAPYCGFGFRVNSVSRVQILDNRIEGIPADGIQMAGTADVTIKGNRFERIHPFIDTAEHADSIQLVGGNKRTRIEDNVFVDARGIIAHPWLGEDDRWPGSSSDMVLKDNLFARMTQWSARLYDVDGLDFSRNTAWDGSTFGVQFLEDPDRPEKMRRVTFTGNIVQTLEAGAGMFASSDDNLVGEGPLIGGSDITGQPYFRNPASLDYRLLPDSPFTGKGAQLSAQGGLIASSAGLPANG